MSRFRLSTIAVVLGLLGGLALTPTASREGRAQHEGAALVLYASDDLQQEGFSLNDFSRELERRVPDLGASTPSEIKRAARKAAGNFESEVDRKIKIRVGYSCCPHEITLSVSW